jgi:hypothetical protein
VPIRITGTRATAIPGCVISSVVGTSIGPVSRGTASPGDEPTAGIDGGVGLVAGRDVVVGGGGTAACVVVVVAAVIGLVFARAGGGTGIGGIDGARTRISPDASNVGCVLARLEACRDAVAAVDSTTTGFACGGVATLPRPRAVSTRSPSGDAPFAWFAAAATR